MSENVNVQIVNGPDETAEEEQARKNAEIRETLRKAAEEERARLQDAIEAMKEGKGRLGLETPIVSGEKTVTELAYDFTELTGMEYTEAMDADPNSNAQNLYRLTYRQGLALFAKAAAKQSDGLLDMQDIVSRIGATDAAEGVQLATIFFGASIRAGQKRISKR